MDVDTGRGVSISMLNEYFDEFVAFVSLFTATSPTSLMATGVCHASKDAYKQALSERATRSDLGKTVIIPGFDANLHYSSNPISQFYLEMVRRNARGARAKVVVIQTERPVVFIEQFSSLTGIVPVVFEDGPFGGMFFLNPRDGNRRQPLFVVVCKTNPTI